MSLSSSMRRFVFGVANDFTSAARQRFPEPNARKEGLESIGRVVVTGYHRAIELADPTRIEESLAPDVDRGLLSFAIEGAAMGFMVLDMTTFWRRTDYVGELLR